MKNYIVLDTETIGVLRPKIFDMGWVVVDGTTHAIIEKRSYGVHSLLKNRDFMLGDTFVGETKYKAYLNEIRKKEIISRYNFPFIVKRLASNIKKYNICYMYAFNSAFDENHIASSLEYAENETHKTFYNPLEDIIVRDIRGYLTPILTSAEFRKWAETNEKFTDSKNALSATAETITQYIRNDLDYKEKHLALADALDEKAILDYCRAHNIDIATQPQKVKIIPNSVKRTLTIKIGEKVQQYEYTKKTQSKDGETLTLK